MTRMIQCSSPIWICSSCARNQGKLQDNPTVGMLQNRSRRGRPWCKRCITITIAPFSLSSSLEWSVFLISVIDMLAFDVRGGIGQFQRIINDHDIPAATG